MNKELFVYFCVYLGLFVLAPIILVGFKFSSKDQFIFVAIALLAFFIVGGFITKVVQKLDL